MKLATENRGYTMKKIVITINIEKIGREVAGNE
jgi:hypothetical protein